MVERFKPKSADWFKWGVLVKKWARGEINRPNNITELLKQCTDHGMAEPDGADFVKGVVFVQGDRNTLLIRLPPAETLQAFEEALQQPGSIYDLPPFYPDLPEMTAEEKFELQASRIGEYAINSCL